MIAAATTCMLALAGCTAPGTSTGSQSASRPPVPSVTGTPSATTEVPPRTDSAPGQATATPTPDAAPTTKVDVAALRATVDTLAGRIGPREATSRAYRQAARLIDGRLADLGYQVTQQQVPVPTGNSWGVPVPAGTSTNVVAVAPGTDLTEPYLVVGAHLDTVPQAPGAADNASGVSVVLEVARLAMLEPPPQPVVFVAFGAEEPRGPGDDLHHFGSQAYVAGLAPAERSALIGAIAVDTVGVSSEGVPVCTARDGRDAFTDQARAAADDAAVRLRECVNRTSDHWSFVRNGLDGTRVGLAGTEEYAAYHSPDDVPAVVGDRRLAQAARAVWAMVSHEW